ncbi:MAG TPA: hypothetical protein VK619_07395 [Pyrinomonadaceae bacterium]|nr:hypothetical protein [Pyrinomonadaceae bacterium]
MNLSDYRHDFAAYNSAIQLAYYKYRSGLENELHLEPIIDRYGDLFTPGAITSLEQAMGDTPENFETERAGLHALLGAARVGFLEAQARRLTEERAHCESTAHIEWRGENVSAFSVTRLIANEPDAFRRRELTARWVDALGVCDDLRAARLESFRQSAKVLGFDSYRALYSHITGTDYELLAALTDRFLERTEAAYSSALAKAAARDLPGVRFNELAQGDYLFFQRMFRLDPVFTAQDLMRTYAAAMNNLGISVEKQKNIYIDAESRPAKYPRAACFIINPPEDVRFIIAPTGGVYDYTTLFHEAGHAQHFGWVSRDLASRHPEFIFSPDYATTEGYAFLLNHLYLDAGWLLEHRPNLRENSARSIVRDLALITTHQVRRYAAKLRYEIGLHDSADFRSDHLAESYRTLQEQATLFRRNAGQYLMDIDDGFYSAAYLRAWAFEAGLREYLRTRYGRRWWAVRRAGDELIDLWSTASRYSIEELARLVGFGEISFDLLADSLIAAMNEG